jgi:rare lipoprotein A
VSSLSLYHPERRSSRAGAVTATRSIRVCLHDDELQIPRALKPTWNDNPKGSVAITLAILLLSFLLTGCGEHKQARVNVPTPPPMSEPDSQTNSVSTEPPAKTAVSPGSDEDALRIPADAKPISVETGLASWYGGPYHNRRGSNGEIYNMHAMTAAHRTLPLGSIVRVTNVKTGHSALVRITDRGPFVEGRVLDLSQAAAKKVDVWQAGVAMVRIEVLRASAPLESGGRWAVQIGAFEEEHSADKFADHLSHRYHTAKVLCFSSPVGDWWVRVRVQDDDRKRAEEVARNTQTSQGSIFLVRLD